MDFVTCFSNFSKLVFFFPLHCAVEISLSFFLPRSERKESQRKIEWEETFEKFRGPWKLLWRRKNSELSGQKEKTDAQCRVPRRTARVKPTIKTPSRGRARAREGEKSFKNPFFVPVVEISICPTKTLIWPTKGAQTTKNAVASDRRLRAERVGEAERRALPRA